MVPHFSGGKPLNGSDLSKAYTVLASMKRLIFEHWSRLKKKLIKNYCSIRKACETRDWTFNFNCHRVQLTGADFFRGNEIVVFFGSVNDFQNNK